MNSMKKYFIQGCVVAALLIPFFAVFATWDISNIWMGNWDTVARLFYVIAVPIFSFLYMDFKWFHRQVD